MGSKMLIDAAHPEETRVVVVRGNRIEDFDYESATRKQLKGNIYLAKVTRVEPSLQAAFVDYGGNRHGFLAFNEIHPDYYQIPVADRQALLEEEAEEASRDEEDDDEDEAEETAAPAGTVDASAGAGEPAAALDAEAPESVSAPVPESEASSEVKAEAAASGETGNGSAAPEAEVEHVESVGSEDALEELPVRSKRRRRMYKIQEVIKRRQIILVQVVKEERGNKGAALTTYLSLAGRYTVLMPNTARGGGISRKITNATDRKRLRKIATDLEVADGMGLIIRTAGASRTKAEVKRDCEYLLRMWENIRELTLKSTAPALVYEEGNLIKRSIRDLYDKDIDSIEVAGDEAYKEAKGFMKMLMPSHAKNVQPYKEPEPIFVRHQIERQLSAMFSPQVTLRSGGYIVLNQTEALVAIDVNSGRATREHSIEETALKTNLEACDEVARQLRLRDLAGLIVIDFIDMEERRNNRAVERRIKERLKSDRARIQVGRISHFGLLEMSRQRLRTGVVEGSTRPCSMCQGSGYVRSTESVALDVLRNIEDSLMSEGPAGIVASTSVEAALYILNQKRAALRDMESRYAIPIAVNASDELHGANFRIERTAKAVVEGEAARVVRAESGFEQTANEIEPEVEEAAEAESGEQGEKRGGRRRRRRRRGRGDDQHGEGRSIESRQHAREQPEGGEAAGEERQAQSEEGEREQGQRRPRRRGRRGGRRSRGERGDRGDKRQQQGNGQTAAGSGDSHSGSNGSENGGHGNGRGEDAVSGGGEAAVPSRSAPPQENRPEPAAEPAPPPSSKAEDNNPEPPVSRRGGWWQRRLG
ncbi:MAG: ribonuclease E/G [Pseudomonadota bacterium]|nr:ribonuclease E/G [Pseudomonadota bacterium]